MVSKPLACDQPAPSGSVRWQGPNACHGRARRRRPDLSLVATGRPAIGVRFGLVARRPGAPGASLGIVGHYAAADADSGVPAGGRLRCAARARRDARGRPNGCDTWYRYRLVTWRSDETSFLLEPDNPDAWGSHFESAGFVRSPATTLRAAMTSRHCARRRDGRAARRRRLPDSHFDRSRIDADLHALWAAACDAFACNLLYTPVTEEEFRSSTPRPSARCRHRW